jgi:hypothetical protein
MHAVPTDAFVLLSNSQLLVNKMEQKTGKKINVNRIWLKRYLTRQAYQYYIDNIDKQLRMAFNHYFVGREYRDGRLHTKRH